MVLPLDNVAALLRIRSERLSTARPSKQDSSIAENLPDDVVTISDVGRKQAVAKAVADRLVQELTSSKGEPLP
jgi:hypothetical protein